MKELQHPYIYELRIKVRDYELDSEGIVNNANYLHYFEYTRHEFCLAEGCSFDELRKMGIFPVVSRAEIDYKNSLRSGDVILSRLWIERKGPRFIFHQDLYRESDNATVANALISIASIENGRINRGDELASIFGKFLQ